MMQILSFMTGIVTSIIQSIGYPGIFLLMALESTAAPVPSELVMPFAGFLASQGRYNIYIVILVGSLGCLFGSLASYYGGKYLGMPFIRRYGKYFFLTEKDLEWTILWFNKHGEKTIFISRFIPVVRHIISIPAGVANMNVARFSLYTLAGSMLWVAFLTYLGFTLGENWESVRNFTEKISLAVVVLIALVVIWYVWKHVKEWK